MNKMDNQKALEQDLEQVGNALTAANQIRNLISETDHDGFLAGLLAEVEKQIDYLFAYEKAVKDFTNK